MAGGRPRKHPDDYLPQLCQALELGAWYWAACRYARLSYSTFRRWMLAGEAAEATEEMHDFVTRIRQAQATAALRDLRRINAAALAGDWQAARWLLARRYPDAYGTRVVAQRHSGDVTQAVQVVVHRAEGEPGPQAGARTTADTP